MNTQENDFFQKHFSSAVQRLFSIPGVMQVGYGLKEKSGGILAEYVLRVYVKVKKPPEELTAEEMIPPVVEGIRTDVHTYILPQHSSSLFTSKARAGEKVTLVLNLGGMTMKSGYGTITCLVRKDNKKYAMSCGHVYSEVLRDGQFIGGGNFIYIPDTCRCDCLNIECRSKAGDVDNKGVLTDPLNPDSSENTTFNGKKYEIDCGLAFLQNEVSFNNNVPDVGLIKRQLRDITTEANPVTNLPNGIINVRKHGATTGLTNGIVTELCIIKNPATDTIWVMKIKPDPGQKFREEHDIDPQSPSTLAQIISLFNGMPVTARLANPGDPSSRKIIFEGKIFVNHGDSGSAIVDSNLQVGGILHKGIFVNILTTKGSQSIPTGIGVACYILPVFSFLGLDVNNAILQPGDPIAGQPIQLMSETDAPDQSDLLKLEKEIYETPRGKEILDEFFSHSAELVELVHHNRRVKFCWHSNKCPQFFISWVSSVKQGFNVPFKKTVGEIPIGKAFANLFNILNREGSQQLQQTLAKYHSFLKYIINGCTNVQEVVKAFGGNEELTIQMMDEYDT